MKIKAAHLNHVLAVVILTLLFGFATLASAATTVTGQTSTSSAVRPQDTSGLNQKQSQTVNSDTLVTIGAGNIITDTNISNTAVISNVPFLMWGNNDGSIEDTIIITSTDLAQTPPSAPGGVDDSLGVWLKADVGAYSNGDSSAIGTTAATEGGAVASWDDSSPNDNYFYEDTADNPIFRENAEVFNFNPSISLEAVNQGLGTDFEVNSMPYSFYTVYSYEGFDYTGQQFAADSGFVDWGVGAAGGAGSEGFNRGNGITYQTPLANQPLNQARIGLSQTTAGESAFFLNGLDVTANASPGIAPGQIGFGAENTFSNAMQGDTAEMIYFDRILTAAERQQIESYLAIKYGVTLTLEDALSQATGTGHQTWGTGINARGQSFVSTFTGELGQIAFSTRGIGSVGTFDLEIYDGAGFNGTLLHTQAGEPYVGGLNTVEIDGNVPLVDGNTYTFKLIKNSGSEALDYDALGNLYTDGSLHFGDGSTPLANADLVFGVYPKAGNGYILSDGDTVVWEGVANGGYNNNIAGIGRDDTSALNQKQSQSSNSDAIVTIGAGNMITSTNISNTAVITDENFLMWGNNDGAATWAASGAPADYKLFDRSWQVQETGELGSVLVQFNMADAEFDVPTPLAGADYYIVVDTDDDRILSDETPIALTNASGDLWTVSLDFADDAKFTLATGTDTPSVINVNTTITATSTITADGSAASTVTVQLANALGQLINTGGHTVTLSPTGSATVSGVTDNSDGTYSATVTNTVSETVTITGTVNTLVISNTADIVFISDNANPSGTSPNTTITASSPITADGSMTSTVTVQLADANGNLLNAGGHTVTLSSSSGTTVVSAVTDNGDGTYRATVTNVVDETVTITGSVNGNAITDDAEIVFTPDLIFPLAPVMIAPAQDEVVTIIRPVITGTAEAGATLTVTIAGADLVTIVAADGSWVVTPTVDLQLDGPFTPTLTIADPYGNVTGPVDGNRFFVDANAPLDPVMVAPAGNEHINIPRPVITGTAEAGALMTVTINGETLTATVSVDGAWAVTPTIDLPYGPYTPTMTVMDPAGNVNGPVDGNTFTVDTDPPAAPPIDYPIDGGSTNGNIDGSGAEPGNTITVTVQGTGETCSTIVAPDGTWTCNLLPLPVDGPITIESTQTDLAGNTSPAITVTTTMDSTRPPPPIIDEPVANGHTKGEIGGSGANPGDTITVTVQGTGETCAVVADTDGNWACTLSPTPVDGPIVLEATATDPTGNTSLPTTVPAIVDNTPSEVPIINAPTNGKPVTGIGEPGATVTVTTPSGGSCTAVVQPNGTWSCTLDPEPAEGEEVTVSQTDPAGNTSPTSTVPGGIDTTPPPAPIINTPTSGSPVDGTGEPGATVTVTTPSGGSCTAVVQPNGTWSCTLDPEPAEGEEVTVSQTDPAGNTGPSTTVPIVDVNDPLQPDRVYLPFVARDWSAALPEPLPDLIVESVTVSADTPIYDHVDAFHPSTTYGTVLEDHEANRGVYTNITQAISGAADITSATSDRNQTIEEFIQGDLPTRDKTDK